MGFRSGILIRRLGGSVTCRLLLPVVFGRNPRTSGAGIGAVERSYGSDSGCLIIAYKS